MLWHLLQQAYSGNAGAIRWIVIFLEEGPLANRVSDLGIDVRIVPAGRLRQPHRMLLCVARITAIARRERADLIFSWMPKAHFYGAPAALFAGVPAAWYQLGMPARENLMDRLTTLLPAAGVLACSRAGAEAQSRLWPPRPVSVVHPGAELDRFDPGVLPPPNECRRRLGLPEEGAIIGIVGRLQRWKGFHVLVEAMPQILDRRPDVRCVLVGGEHNLEPDYPHHLRARIEALGLSQHVIMTGLQRNIPEWVQAMDVFIHASDREPFGIVIIEAMALGKPVVAANSAGPTEIISPGVDGLLTPYGDEAALAEAVLKYLEDPCFATRAGQAARRRAMDFSTEAFATAVTKMIRECV